MASINSEILLCLGNRWVVFGPPAGLPRPRRFGPDDGDRALPRIGDEADFPIETLIKTIKLSHGQLELERGPDRRVDFTIRDVNGASTLVELKRSPVDGARYGELLSQLQSIAKERKLPVEAWLINSEPPSLRIVHTGPSGELHSTDMLVEDVWEYGKDEVYNRAHVVGAVADWAARIDALYATIQQWASTHPDLTIRQDRQVVMSEWQMQIFAVPDRELPILDLVRGDETVLTFVPRGRWVVGANGRIDVITTKETRILVDIGVDGAPYGNIYPVGDWKSGRRFDESTFNELVSAS